MTNADNPIGERVVAVEKDIKHMLDGIVRIEGSVGRIENVAIKEETKRLEADIARVDRRVTETRDELKSDIARLDDRITETRDELRSDIARVEGRIVESKKDYQDGLEALLASVGHNRTAVYVMCGTVVVGMIAALMKDTFL